MGKKLFCASCGLELRQPEFKCIYCGSEEQSTISTNDPIPVTKKEMEEFIIGELKRADCYIKSPFRCHFCNKEHYMIWPGKRDHEDYERIRRLTILPQCPKRVWLYGKHEGIGMSLNNLLKELEVK